MAATTSPAVPRVSEPADSGPRRGDIQGLRGVAVLLVVLFHAGSGLSGGFVGVDLFFVVSGFVITGLLTRELDRYGRVRFGPFYLRRARRLLPALAVVSLVTLVGSAFLLSPLSGVQQATGTAAVAASVFAANGYFLTDGYFNPVAEGNPLLHMWSLSVEEQFYLGFPLLLLFGWFLRRRFSARCAVLVFVLVLVVSLGIAVCFTFGRLPSVPGLMPFLDNPRLSANFAFFTPMARGWEFLVGALLALVIARRRPSIGFSAISGVSGAALLCLAAIGITSTDPFPGWLAAVPVLGTALLLIAGSGGPAGLNVLPRLLSARPMMALGDISYSWYLWHWPVIVLARTTFPDTPGIGLTAALLSLAPAIASYRLVEWPVHHGHRMTTPRATTALIAGCLVLPMAFGYGLRTAAQDGWGQERIAEIQAAVLPEHLDAVSGCTSRAALGSARRPPCSWVVPNARGTVLLIGDSNAGHLTEPFIAAAHANRLDAEVATTGGCPFVVLRPYLEEACQAFVEGSLRAIAARKPAYDAIVISNASVGYVNGYLAPKLAIAGPAGGGIQEQAIAGWARGIDETVQRVAADSPVILIGAVPQHKDFPACLARTIFAEAEPGCGKMSAEAASRQRDGVVAGDRKAIAKVSGRYLDTARRLCSSTAGCSTSYHNVQAYRDGAHLSVAGSAMFQDDLRIALGYLVKAPGKRG
ncbi:MAG: acyltransferase family protein [Actinoplanes sp.]